MFENLTRLTNTKDVSCLFSFVLLRKFKFKEKFHILLSSVLVHCNKIVPHPLKYNYPVLMYMCFI